MANNTWKPGKQHLETWQTTQETLQTTHENMANNTWKHGK